MVDRGAEARERCRCRSGEAGLMALRELCAAKIEDWRDELERAAKPENCAKLQGKISGLRELLEDITPRQDVGHG
jgi:hypothetical protein